jgi:DNA-binding MarR family transcriptional regulator
MNAMADRYPRDDELGAWREFLRAHARLTRQMETDLVREQRLSLASYDVLVQLAEAPERRLRMTDLANALLLSRSGVTRLVGRLERIGLVSRSRAAGDGRGVVAELTDRGLDRLRTASGTHLSGITRHFADRLDPAQLAALAEICSTLAGPSVNPSRPAETRSPVPTQDGPAQNGPGQNGPAPDDPAQNGRLRNGPVQGGPGRNAAPDQTGQARSDPSRPGQAAPVL